MYIDDSVRPARQRANASWNSTADWKRCAGSFASARVTTSSTQPGKSARTMWTGVGGSLTCDCASANGVSPLNGSAAVVSR